MEPEKKKLGRPAGQLTPMQAAVLNDLLADKPFSEIAIDNGMLKGSVAEVVKYLREHGLVVMPDKDSGLLFGETVNPGGSPKVVWFREKKKLWQVIGVTLPHVISAGRARTDLLPDRVVIVVLSPIGELTFVVSNRQRISYKAVSARLAAAGLDVGEETVTVQKVTGAIALLVEQEAVLPPWFMKDNPTGGQ